LLAVDGGGSKIDATLLRRDGTVLGARRVAAGDYERTGDDAFLDPIDEAIRAAWADAGLSTMPYPVADVGVFCLAGADLPVDDRRIDRGLARRGWVGEHVLRNDTFAVLRAGTDRTWGVGIVCGFGTNCSGVSPEGRVFRLPAIGPVSGDWGGGGDLGTTALWHAIRAGDGRGGRTGLQRSVPAHFGMRTARQVMEASRPSSSAGRRTRSRSWRPPRSASSGCARSIPTWCLAAASSATNGARSWRASLRACTRWRRPRASFG
jgi:N-acetylglucosamine kinase-like BadF-type ATPase